MINLDIKDPVEKNRHEHRELERMIDNLKKEIRELRECIKATLEER